MFFAGVAESELETALAGVEHRLLPKGSLVVSEGDYLEEMYVVVSGSADVAVAGDNGRNEIVARIQPGETIGEMSILTHEPASADVRAHEELDVLVVKDRDLDQIVDQLPKVQRNIIAILSARLAHMNKLAASHQRAHLVLVEDGAAGADGGGLGAAGLAAGIAWHTRATTLHLAITEAPRPELARLTTVAATPPFNPMRESGADFMIAPPGDGFAPERIGVTLELLGAAFDYVVVQHPPGFRASLARAEHPTYRLTDLPELSPADADLLARGSLPPAVRSGGALGKVAREAVGLRVGIALGSGSVRGYAHVGALRTLKQLGVPIDCVAGTSIGAIVGAAYCHFEDTERVAEFLDELGNRMFRPTLSRKSLLSTRALRRYTAKAVGDRLMEELGIPLAAVATDVETREEVVFRRGSTVTAVLASASIPGVFPALRVGGRTLVDGGIVNPLPTTAAADLGADVVVAVRLVSGGGRADDAIAESSAGPLPSAVAAIMRSVELVQTRITPRAGSGPTIIVTPQFGEIAAAKMRHFRDGRRYIPLGEEAVVAALPRLQSALPWLRDG
jgi:NTE family protein